jgi:hypothetical protein
LSLPISSSARDQRQHPPLLLRERVDRALRGRVGEEAPCLLDDARREAQRFLRLLRIVHQVQQQRLSVSVLLAHDDAGDIDGEPVGRSGALSASSRRPHG